MSILRKIQWHQILIAGLVGFALGTFVGPPAGRMCLRPEWKYRGDRADMKTYMLDRFSRKLGLSEGQKQEVASIFEAKHPKMIALHEEIRPKFEAIRNETDRAIRPLLTDSQLKKYDEMQAKTARHWGKRTVF
jgi:hypothetical protein